MRNIIYSSSNTNGLASLPSSPNVIQSSSQPTKDVEVKNLINPVPVTWIKSGYLMLRMKLPNNTYAWTYIVRYIIIFNIIINLYFSIVLSIENKDNLWYRSKVYQNHDH